MVSATHTHTGPARDRQPLTENEEEYWRSLPCIVARAVIDAWTLRQPACARVARGWSAIGVNRREERPNGLVWLGKNEYGRFDPEVGVLRVDRATGEPLAAVVSYACHAVALGGEVLLSADYPGFVVRQFECSLGLDSALFLQGAAGNVDPRASGTGYFVGQRIRGILAKEWSAAGLERKRLMFPPARCNRDQSSCQRIENAPPRLSRTSGGSRMMRSNDESRNWRPRETRLWRRRSKSWHSDRSAS